jgi:ParB family chromosome partitioning protein
MNPVVGIAVEKIEAPGWNPNEMDEDMRRHLRRSMERFGNLIPLVVRIMGQGRYETVGGAHRLEVLKESGCGTAPCIVVDIDDSEARLLSQALNHITGSDNLGLRAQVLRDLLHILPQREVLELLPETSKSLSELTSLGEQSIAQALQHWEEIQKARLRHLSFQLTDAQLSVVEEALERLGPAVGAHAGNPNRRGNTLFLLCQMYLAQGHLEIGTKPEEERS